MISAGFRTMIRQLSILCIFGAVVIDAISIDTLTRGIDGIEDIGDDHNHKKIIDLHAPAQYDFSYGVSDPKTGDKKQHSESRIGDVVRGQYSLVEPDGTLRVVKYTSDGKNGFNAVVSSIGHAVHPQVLIGTTVVPLTTRRNSLGRLGIGGWRGGVLDGSLTGLSGLDYNWGRGLQYNRF